MNEDLMEIAIVFSSEAGGELDRVVVRTNEYDEIEDVSRKLREYVDANPFRSGDVIKIVQIF